MKNYTRNCFRVFTAFRERVRGRRKGGEESKGGRRRRKGEGESKGGRRRRRDSREG